MAHDEERASITSTGTARGQSEPSGRWGWLRWRELAAEAVGTALLVLLTCLATAPSPAAPADPSASVAAPPLLQRALASGLVVALIVQCFGHVSGAQLNPAVSLAAGVAGRRGARGAAAEAAAQLAGAGAGAALLAALAGGRGAHCVTQPAPGVSVYTAVCVEALLGACLSLANCAAWDARASDSWPLRVGGAVAALALAAGDVTGASMNPARSLAPALCSGRWRHHWVYWAGPLSGAALAAALYRALWRGELLRGSRAQRAGDHEEDSDR